MKLAFYVRSTGHMQQDTQPRRIVYRQQRTQTAAQPPFPLSPFAAPLLSALIKSSLSTKVISRVH